MAAKMVDRHSKSNGQGQKRGPAPNTFADIWSRIEKKDPDECWPFLLKSRNSKGYGRIAIGQRLYLPHVVAYIGIHGDIPKGLLILHRCDNPICCNPSHLYAGTHQQNMEDAKRNGKIGGYRPCTEETRHKISQSMKQRRAENPAWGKSHV
jgi:hypothetical protein